MSEQDEQIMLFRWAELSIKAYPELRWMYHVPNGQLRSVNVARKLKSMGVKPGVSDICLPVSRKGFYGLYIESKFGKNTLTQNQIDFGKFVTEQGYLFVACNGFEAMKSTIKNYLSE